MGTIVSLTSGMSFFVQCLNGTWKLLEVSGGRLPENQRLHSSGAKFKPQPLSVMCFEWKNMPHNTFSAWSSSSSSSAPFQPVLDITNWYLLEGECEARRLWKLFTYSEVEELKSWERGPGKSCRKHYHSHRLVESCAKHVLHTRGL